MISSLWIKDQQQIEEIVTLLKYTSGTGCFLFVTCSGPVARGVVEEGIRCQLGDGSRIETINLIEGERDLAARIRERLAPLKEPPPVYFIDGLPEVVADEKVREADGLPRSLLQLNMKRDLFAFHRLQLLFWLDEPTDRELFWKAGDLWAVRSGHWTFRHEADLKAKIVAEMEERAALFEAHDLRRRAEEHRELLSRYEKLRPDDRLGMAKARGDLAEILIMRGELREARDILLEALKEMAGKDGAESSSCRGTILLSLGRVQGFLGELRESESTLQDALAILRRLREPRGEANALGNLGVLYGCRGELARAEATFKQLLGTFQELHDIRGEANALGNLGMVHLHRGDLTRAENDLEEALARFRRLSDPLAEAITLGNLGALHRDRGELARAESTLQAALTALHGLGDQRSEAISLTDVGVLYRDRGELARAESTLQAALATFRRIGDIRSAAIAEREVGVLWRDRGELARAETTLQEVLATFRRIGDAPNEARTLDALALTGQRLKREEEAERYRAEAERLFKAIGVATPTESIRREPASKGASRRKPVVRPRKKTK